MTTSTRLAGTTALISLFWGAAAHADVAPADVWGDFKRYLEDFGYSVTASEQESGGTLVVRDIVMGMQMPDEAGEMSLSMGEMSFVDNGDGSVSLEIPETMPVVMEMTIEGDAVVVAMDYTSRGFDMQVTGDPDDMRYDYSADSLGLTLSDVQMEGESAPEGMIRAVMELTGVSGSSATKSGDLREMVQDVSAETLTYDVAVAPPEEGRFALSGEARRMVSTNTSSFPPGIDMNDMAAALNAGFAIDAAIDHGGGSTRFSFDEGNGNVTEGSSSSSGGTFGITMSAERLAYRVGGDDVEMMLQGGEIPFPVNFAMSKILTAFSVPVSKGEEAQDLAINVTMQDFTMSDMIWSIIDGQEVLPRDPATIVVDLTAKVQMLVDLMDPDAMASVERGETLPALPQSLTLNQLTVAAAGARLDGDGALTFDPTDMQTIPGVPRPEGAVNLRVDGANGLIDKLIRMGLMAEQDAMGARMMMSMFTVPGDGEDQLRSTIEINEQGHVLANGQRIR